MKRNLFSAALLLAAAASAHASSAVHINIHAVGGSKQTVGVNQPLPRHFVARVTLDDGTPIPGIKLGFAVNACMQVSSGTSSCPAATLYGRFAGDPSAVTNAEGNAESPGFVAGKLSGTYSVFAAQFGFTQEIGGKTFSAAPVIAPASNVFSITQVSAAPSSVPALSWPALLLLAGGMVAAGLLHGRVRKAR